MARSPGCPGWMLCGKCRVGVFGWLRFDVFGAFMFFKGVGRCR